jgi:DNA-binding MarR family transcriptional regulator
MEAPFMKNTQKTPNDWLAILKQAGRKKADEVPPGWNTVIQIAEETGKSKSHTAKMLNEAVEAGMVDRKEYIIDRRSKIQSVPHYKIR